MRSVWKSIVCWLALIPCLNALAVAQVDQEWIELSALPDLQGVASPVVGVSRGKLIVAGGANFPGKKPWEGGIKQWHRAVYMLDLDKGFEGSWEPAGSLPRNVAYSVSVSLPDGSILSIGGSDERQHFREVDRIEWKESRLVVAADLPLPEPIANACGALVGTCIYVAGGQSQPDSCEALASFYVLDLAAEKREWRKLATWPGEPRILATAGNLDGHFYLVGGAKLTPTASGKPGREYLSDAYRYSPEKGWEKIASLPIAQVASPSPMIATDKELYLLGGDDGSQQGRDPLKHQGFTRRILRYDLAANQWNWGESIPAPVVTTSTVDVGNRWIIPSGEVRPGVRTPQVWSFQPAEQSKSKGE